MPDFYVPKISEVKVRREGTNVQLISNGQMILELPWDAALMVVRAITIQARRAEEEAKATQIIADQALLIRLGIPLGLTSNPVMLHEAGKEAACDSYLRRMLPGGVKSQEAFGTPTIIRHKPKKGGNNDHK